MQPIKGRGAVSNLRGRFETRTVEPDRGADTEIPAERRPMTSLTAMRVSGIISRNESPDVPFNRSINPYVGCEHGCIYCYARPAHSYLDLSPGLDFETRIFYKPEAAARLEAEWAKPGYECEPITIGANTDPYQPAERETELTRKLLELFVKYRHPVTLITKSNLVLRDLDLLSQLAAENLCSVAVSVTTLDANLKRILEPRAPSAPARLQAIERLAAAGIPTTALVAPVIPAINDTEIERIVDAVAEAGASHAAYIFLRLPHELKQLFAEWLDAWFPDRAARVLSLVRQASGGRDYDSRFGLRQTGRGPYADMIAKRFDTACRRAGLNAGRSRTALDCSLFERPGQRQLGLPFG